MEDIPIGFSMALAENLDAMQAFSKLSREEQQRVIAEARNIRSRRSMGEYVLSLTNNNTL